MLDQDMAAVYEEFAPVVYKYLFCLTRDHALSEELMQETFYQAMKSIRTFRGECKISVWLCQIAKHLLYRHWEKAGRQIPTEPEELAQNAPAAKENTESAVLTRIELIDCLKELQKLPEQLREVMYLRVMSDLSYREIGEIMGKSENWARVTFYRAKEALLKGRDRNE